MRVAVVAMETSQYRDTEGRSRLERVATELADAGHDVTVFCSQWWTGFDNQRERNGVTYRAVTVSPTIPSFCVRLPFLLARFRPDVVHVHPTPASVALAANTGATLSRAPLLTEWFGEEDVPESRQAALALQASDCLITPSELVRTRVRERGATADQTAILPQSIDMDLIREAEADEEIDVVYARTLDGSANVESLLLGLAELRHKDWSATIVGDGPERGYYEQEAANLRIGDRVTFAGQCDIEERVSIYKGAHVFVQTAFQECFATDLLWAMACGCIGIVEYQAESSAHELIEQRDRAFRVTNPQEIADKIAESADFECRTVDESCSEFDHARVRSEYEEVYEERIEDYGFF
ncbi:MAG: glycosyltransferase [Haloarcula sp.]